ncbi:hypothetical protein IWQ62_001084 [Dispira parvispora]|uniref:LIM zinc-binding domain-containing protein n=1 Tax=Dispira parvispora TaxID=1520584 RepID=A0A9W8E8K3_9FUNG|nr:hypothetical protein IWQ62_001084 [Dispira parvispora]
MRFPGPPKCPRCDRSVYVAEQAVGPGGPWHRSCLTCAQCNTRLDSGRFVDKEGEAYCRICYNKLFGPKGYKLAGGTSPASQETRLASEIRSRSNSRVYASSSFLSRSPSVPTTPTQDRVASSSPNFASWGYHASTEVREQSVKQNEGQSESTAPPASGSFRPVPSPTISKNENALPSTIVTDITPPLPARSPAKPTYSPASPMPSQPAYGWNSHNAYVPRKLHVSIQNDVCAKCKKVVYAAELVNGAGKRYHRACFRCTECNRGLDASILTESDNQPYCKRCYGKLFGPKGYGYAGGAAFLTSEGTAR